nr:hypothetical protein [Tanacetum cinerariifolium]
MRNMINLHTIRDDSLLGTLKSVSKTQDYQQYGALIPYDMINQNIKDSKAYKTYYDFDTGKATPKKARKYKKVASPSRKLSPVLEEEPAEKSKRAGKPAKKSTTIPTAGVLIRDTPRESVSKKKTPAKVYRGKGMDLFSNASLLEAAQVPDESEDKTTSTYERTDSDDDKSNDDDSDEVTKDDDDDEDDIKSDANEDKEDSDSEQMDSDDDKNLNDVDVKSLDAEHEKERKGDAEMTDADKNVSQERSYEQVIDDAHDNTISMRNMINLHTIHDGSLLGTLKSVSKTQDYQQYGALIPYDMINQNIKDSKAYKTYYDFDTGKATPKKARKYKKVASPSRKLSPVLEEEPTEKSKRARKPAKKSTTIPTTGVVIRDTPRESVSKKKTPAKVDRGKGMDLFSNASLLEAAQVPDESEDKTTSTYERTGTKPRVLNVPKYLSESENESWGDSDDDKSNDDDSDEVTKDDDDDEDDIKSDANEDKEDSDSEQMDSDDDKNLSDVDVKLLDAEHEKERKGDAKMTDADKNVSQERSYEQVIDDAHAAASLNEFELKKILLDKLEKSKSYRAAEQHRDLYDALVKSYQLDKDPFDSYGKAYFLKRDREDKDKDEDPPADQTNDTEIPQDQGGDMGNTKDQPNVEEASKHDWLKKPERPPTPDRDWNAGKQIDF